MSAASSEEVLSSRLSLFEAPNSPSVWPQQAAGSSLTALLSERGGGPCWEGCINLTLTISRSLYSKAITAFVRLKPPSGIRESTGDNSFQERALCSVIH